MEHFLNVGLPILIVVAFYFILKMVNRKDKPNVLLAKIRIAVGLIGVGVFLHIAYSSESLRAAVPSILLAMIVFYGVVSMQKKYLPFKN